MRGAYAVQLRLQHCSLHGITSSEWGGKRIVATNGRLSTTSGAGDFDVVDQPCGAQPTGGEDDQRAVFAVLRALQIGLPAHRHVVRFPAVAVELGGGVPFEAQEIAFAVTYRVADAAEQAIDCLLYTSGCV